jgi:hypothetical protein
MSILDTAVDKYGLVEIVDKDGHRIKSSKEAEFYNTGYYILKYNVKLVIQELSLPFPREARYMLKGYLPIIDEQCEEIHRYLEQSHTSKALRRLRLRENTLWALTSYEDMTHLEVCGVYVCMYVQAVRI